VAAWLKPHDAISLAAARAWQELLARSAPTAGNPPSQNQNSPAKPLLVIGVHMRGTDKVPAVPPSSYFPLIDAYIKFNEPSSRVRIFFASDDQSYVDQAMQRYGSQAFVQAGVPRVAGTIWKTLNATGAHRTGEAVLIDMLMLSKCNFLLKSASALSEFAIYYNPDLIFNSIDLSIPGQLLPHWAQTKAAASKSATNLAAATINVPAEPANMTDDVLSEASHHINQQPPTVEPQTMDEADLSAANPSVPSRSTTQAQFTHGAVPNDLNAESKAEAELSRVVAASQSRGYSEPLQPIEVEKVDVLASPASSDIVVQPRVNLAGVTETSAVNRSPAIHQDTDHRYSQAASDMEETTGMSVN
jgi:hypothetical protein